MGIDLSTDIVGLKLKNPVMVASGTFGYGQEFSKVMDLNKLGAIITKTITLKPWKGNPPPRICETPSGMLNSIGLQNDGVDNFIEEHIPFLKKFKTHVIANIAGHSINEYVEIAMKLDKQPLIKALEINVSCPNVKEGGMAFGQEPKSTADVVRKVKKVTALPIIVKLTPNVTDITEIAKAAESAGADALSLINTLLGMSIDTVTKKPRLGNITGGLSGPAIKPVAVRMVWETAKAVKIPIIGIGGIFSAEDAIEFFLAGAKAVQVGTANFVDTQASIKVIEGIKKFMESNKIKSIKDFPSLLRI